MYAFLNSLHNLPIFFTYPINHNINISLFAYLITVHASCPNSFLWVEASLKFLTKLVSIAYVSSCSAPCGGIIRDILVNLTF